MPQNNQIDQVAEKHLVPSHQDQADDEINPIDLIYPIYKHLKFLIFFSFLVVIVVTIITILTPKIYEAKAVILPESKESSSTGSELKAAFLSQFGIAGIGGSSASTSDKFESVLKSQYLAREVFKRYYYSFKKGISINSQGRSIQSLADILIITKDDVQPILTIKIQSNDPIMAADLINTYILSLDKYNRTSSTTSAQRLRQYVEERLNAVNIELVEAQEKLREFQEKNQAVSIDKQTEATLEALSKMEAQRLGLEVLKAAQEKFYKGPHIEIEKLEAQINALQNNIDRLTYSKDSQVPFENAKGKVEFYIPLKQIPNLNFNESRLLLNVKTKTGVITMLTTQLEQAKLDEAKDMPTINVLDWAKPPELPTKPKLKLNVLLGFVASIFVGIFIIFLMEFIQRMNQDPEASPKWKEMKKGLSLFKRLRRK